MTDRPDVTIDRLDLVIELDHDAGEEAFAALFQKYARRWQEAQDRVRSDRKFAEAERTGRRSGRS